MSQPVENPAETEIRLLTELANEYSATVSTEQKPANTGALTWKDLRWWPVRKTNEFPRAIAVVTRGKQAKQVKTISATNTPELWESWQPVLTEWLAQRANGKRINHDKLTQGEI